MSAAFNLSATLALCLFIFAPSFALAQVGPDSTVFVMRLGRDTTPFTWTVRNGHRVWLDAVARSPRVSFVTTEATLNLDGTVARLERGGAIFDGTVPRDRVWRTGANQATDFTTDRTFAFGDAIVPPGKYTIWTLPSPDGWTRIINRQTGQRHTVCDQNHDLVRIPLAVNTLEEPVEQFTIGIEARDHGGVLRLIWDATVASVPFAVQ